MCAQDAVHDQSGLTNKSHRHMQPNLEPLRKTNQPTNQPANEPTTSQHALGYDQNVWLLQ